MRKMMMVAVAAVVVSAVTVVGAKAAADNYGMAGCGLGSLVFQGSGDQVSQVLAATTNGTFNSQTFGITSGTSNCTPGGKVSATMSRGTYFAANYNEIRREAATGKGERLAALAQLSGCSPACWYRRGSKSRGDRPQAPIEGSSGRSRR